MTGALAALSDEERALLARRPAPRSIEPMKATLTDQRFSDPDWIFEPKLDGVRCAAFRSGTSVRLVSRTGRELGQSYPELEEALGRDACDDFVADGEIVAFAGGVTSFSRLQGRMQIADRDRARKTGIAVFLYLFDLVHLEGYDTRRLPLRARKALLRRALTFEGPVRFTQHRNEAGEDFYREACRKGWEGVIAKRAESRYSSARSSDWLKFKCSNQQEFVIGGFTEPKGSRHGFGALLIGYNRDGELRYAGKVGTGFDERMLADLGRRLRAIERQTVSLRRGGQGAAARTGCAPSSWPRSASASGPATDASATPGSSGCATTSRRARWSARTRRRDEPLGRHDLVKVGRREIELSNPDKVMYPDPGLTKADVAAYYERIADTMLPHVRDRPVSMRRYPDGIDGYGFVHKEVPEHYPGWIRRVEAPKEGGSVTHALITEPATLVYLANQACITPHVWLSRRDRLDRPDRLIFDLDPASDEDFTAVRATARTLGDLLERVGLSSVRDDHRVEGRARRHADPAPVRLQGGEGLRARPGPGAGGRRPGSAHARAA